MTWLTSLPAAVLVIGGLALALLVAVGGPPIQCGPPDPARPVTLRPHRDPFVHRERRCVFRSRWDGNWRGGDL